MYTEPLIDPASRTNKTSTTTTNTTYMTSSLLDAGGSNSANDNDNDNNGKREDDLDNKEATDVSTPLKASTTSTQKTQPQAQKVIANNNSHSHSHLQDTTNSKTNRTNNPYNAHHNNNNNPHTQVNVDRGRGQYDNSYQNSSRMQDQNNNNSNNNNSNSNAPDLAFDNEEEPPSFTRRLSTQFSTVALERQSSLHDVTNTVSSYIPDAIANNIPGFHRSTAELQPTYFCNICFANNPISDGFTLRNCQHQFCVECIRGYFTSKITNGQVLHLKCFHPMPPENKFSFCFVFRVFFICARIFCISFSFRANLFSFTSLYFLVLVLAVRRCLRRISAKWWTKRRGVKWSDLLRISVII